MRVKIVSTTEDESIFIEKFDEPGSLIYAVEGGGDNPARVARRALRFIHRQHGRFVRAIEMQMHQAMPPWRRKREASALIGLLDGIGLDGAAGNAQPRRDFAAGNAQPRRDFIGQSLKILMCCLGCPRLLNRLLGQIVEERATSRIVRRTAA